MFGRRLKVFSLFGFEVKVDVSWGIILTLVVWSLAGGLFPRLYPDLPRNLYWSMGIVGALGLFASIVIHEMCHSLVARRFGIPITGITLFIFGGVAEMEEEPKGPKAELLMAAVGPAASIAIGLIFYVFHIIGVEQTWPVPVNGVLRYLAFINGLLAAFNLLPAFPLDGGRILRSILWIIKDNVQWATRISSHIGSAFGIFFILWGLFSIILGNFISGIWYFVIGTFLQRAAASSYQDLIARKALQGEPVSRFMSRDPVTVPASATLQEFIDDYVYRYRFDIFPVEDRKRFIGCIGINEIRQVDRTQWPYRTVQEVMQVCSQDNTVSPDTDAAKALALMNKTNTSRLLVTEGDRLVGILTLKDMLGFLALRLELDE